jgi:HD-like signal output (HDOD) protein
VSWIQRLLGKTPEQTRAEAAPAARAAAPAGAKVPAAFAWRPAVDVDMLFFRSLLGAGEGAANASNDEEAALIAALDRHSSASDAAALVPRVPSVLPQLLQTLRDPDTSMTELSREVAQDPVLVAAVLNVANSPYYRPAKPIASIEQALLILGHDALRQLIARVAFKPVLSRQSGEFTWRGAPVIWDQSERCGVACHVLAPGVGASGFETFLAALLQNAGTIVSLRVLDLQGAKSRAFSSSFCRLFIADSRRWACNIGRQWGFPADVVNAVAEQDPPATVPPSTVRGKLLRACEQLSEARILFERGEVAMDDLALEDGGPLAACFGRLVPAPAD